jgi:lipopolysaccharide transport system permease protein
MIKPDIKVNNLLLTVDLILVWTYRLIRARYRQSLLGGIWAILQPAATVAVFSVVFVLFVPVNTGDIPYALFSYAAMVPWTLFVTSINDMVDSLVNNMALVTKIYFPREILPVSAVLARLVDFIIASILLVILLVYFKAPISFQGLIFIPLLVLFQVFLALGLGLLGSALNVFYRDVKHIIALGLQLWFYATPIIYPTSLIPDKYLSLYNLNPMAGIINSYRSIFFSQTFPETQLLYSILVSTIIFILGYWFFKKVESRFADVI